MTTATRSRPSSYRASSPRAPLFGMYALLAAALACVGASAGGLFFSSDRPLLVSFAGAMNRCALRFPVTGFLSAHVQELDQCRQAAYRTEGWFVLGAAAVVPLITAGLVFVVPWLDRWRLARAGRWADIPGATVRFGLLCDQVGLTGRLRPRLQVAGLALRQAFTTALPGGRPLVVIPVKTALSHPDPQRFDPILLHELAHVRARDVSWVSTVRGLALVTVPALALASVPAILNGGNLLAQRTFLIQAGAFVACSLLLATALLRRREIDADRQAVQWLGSPAALRRVLDPAATLTRPKAARWRLPLLAGHPSSTARITALRDPVGARDSGFAYALAVGAITAMVINTTYFIAWTFDISLARQLPIRVSAAAGGLMLGLSLTPALLRRAARTRDAGIPARGL
jgi:Zn-dependent protease with chaperone function